MTEENITLESIINGIQPVDQAWIEKAKARTEQLLMPTRALGRLHEISERLCGIQKTLQPPTGPTPWSSAVARDFVSFFIIISASSFEFV